MDIEIVVAVARNGVIGDRGGLPWHLPGDLRRFKRLTEEHPLIMGRRTYESIANLLDGPLPNRFSIVLSSDPSFLPLPPDNVVVTEDFQAAIANAQEFCRQHELDRAFIIGGERVFDRALPSVNRMHLTCVDADVSGDAYFPMLTFDGTWTRAEVGNGITDAQATHPYRFVEMTRGALAHKAA